MSSDRPSRPRRPDPRARRVPPSRPPLSPQVRGLDAPSEPIATVTVRSMGRHPLIFRKMVERPDGPVIPRPGDLVRVQTRESEFVGYGLWNPRSQIAIRLVHRGANAPGAEDWAAKVASAVSLRTRQLKLNQFGNSYRVVHAEADGLPGLVVDRFDDVLSAECYSLGMYERSGKLLSLIAGELGTAHTRVQVDESIAEAEGFAARTALSERLPPVVTINEHGIRYRVRFESGHKTGFFCDQRENREWIAGFCGERSVLDVCAYTGGFGLNAKLRGGASEVTCVDLDERAIALARENANLNQVRLNLVHSDAFGYLRQMIANKRAHGVVVLDPPKLLTNRDEIARGKRKYYDLNALALELVEPGGILLSCSCSGLLSRDDFIAIVRAAARQAQRIVRVLRVTGAAADHPVALDAPETEYLKALWLQVEAP